MKKFASLAALGLGSLAVAACGGSDDASSDLEIENVEMPAEAALEPVTEEPVEDSAATAPEVEGPPPVDTQTAQEAAEAAEGVAAAVEAAEAAAAAEAADAAAAAEAAANLDQ